METQSVPGGNNGKGGRILLIVGVIVIIALLAVIIVLLRNRGNDDTPAPQQADTGSTREVLVTEDNVQDVIAEMEQETVAPGSYEVTMNTDWTFPSNKSTSPNAYVENSTANTNAVYFDVYRSDTEEIIYASPIMPVGSVLDEVTIDTDLAPGTYDAIITYHLVDEEYNDLSEVSMQMTVTIGN